MTVSADISSLTKKTTEPYTAKANVADGGLTSSGVTGDRNTDLFKNASKEMGKDDFLKLLVTQLQYQDPLNPMDNTQFVSQLAQFRALESGSNVEKAITKLDDSFMGSVNAQKYSAEAISNTGAVSLIGKSVRMRQTEATWYAKSGDKVPLRIQLGNANEATVEIRDKDDKVVKTLKVSDKDRENSVKIDWDGSTDKGDFAPAGTYKIYVQGQETDSSLYAFVQDTVAGVRFTAQGALVKIGGKELSIGSVLDVSSGSGSDAISMSPTTAVSLLGKQVRVHETGLLFGQAAGEQEEINVNAPSGSTVSVSLRDTSGKVVRTLTGIADSSGVARLSWNGETNEGLIAEKGVYEINVAGEDKYPELYAFYEGTVDGISNLNGGAQLRVRGQLVSMSDIVDIATPSKST